MLKLPSRKITIRTNVGTTSAVIFRHFFIFPRSGKDTPEGGGDKPRKMPSKMYSSPQLGMKGVKGEDSTSVSSDHSGDVIREVCEGVRGEGVCVEV